MTLYDNSNSNSNTTSKNSPKERDSGPAKLQPASRAGGQCRRPGSCPKPETTWTFWALFLPGVSGFGIESLGLGEPRVGNFDPGPVWLACAGDPCGGGPGDPSGAGAQPLFQNQFLHATFQKISTPSPKP